MKSLFTRVLSCTAVLTLLSGCGKLIPTAREISDYQMITIAGIDKPETGVLLTLSAKQEDTDSNEPFLISNDSETIARAFQEMEIFTDKHIFLGHTHYYLVGDPQARGGLGESLDFILRNPETRLDTRMYIVKDGKAGELLKSASGNDVFAADKLKSLEKDIKRLSSSDSISTLDIARALEYDGCALIPALKLKAAESGSERELDFQSDGFAIVENFKLSGYIEADDSRYVNILRGKFYSDVITVSAPDGKPVSLSLGDMEKKLELLWRDGAPYKLLVDVSFNSRIVETTSKHGVSEPGFLKAVENAQNETVRQGVIKALSDSQKLGADYMGLSGALDIRYPFKFYKYRESWQDIWPGLPFEVEVSSAVSGTYDLTEPVQWEF